MLPGSTSFFFSLDTNFVELQVKMSIVIEHKLGKYFFDKKKEDKRDSLTDLKIKHDLRRNILLVIF